jgi:hypothetical protein
MMKLTNADYEKFPPEQKERLKKLSIRITNVGLMDPTDELRSHNSPHPNYVIKLMKNGHKFDSDFIKKDESLFVDRYLLTYGEIDEITIKEQE